LENHLDIEALPVNSWRDRVPPVAIAMLGAVCAASLFYTPLPLLLVVGIPALYYFVSRPYELLLLMVFLIPFNFVFRIGPIPVAAELLKAFAWIPALIYFGHRRQPFRTSRYNWQFAVLSVLICVAFFRSSDLPYALAQTSRFIFNIGLYYLVINLVDSREKILQIFRVLATSTFLVACYGFYQFIIQDYGALFWIINPRIETSLAHGRDDFWAWRNRITSVLTSEMELGHYFNLCLPVGIVLWVTERFNRLSWRWLWMTIASAVGLILTFTFASWLALIATAAVFVFFFVDKRLRLKLLLGGALALAFVGCIVIFGPLRTFFVEKALGTGVGGLAWDVLGRLDSWLFALQSWWPHPLFGLGVGNYEILQYEHDLMHDVSLGTGGTPHEAYIFLLVQYGLVGLITVLTIMFGSIRSDLRLRADSELGLIAIAIAFALTTQLFEWLADDSPFFGPHASYVVWLFLGLSESIRNLAPNAVAVEGAH
jgi:O-antigen ligase